MRENTKKVLFGVIVLVALAVAAGMQQAHAQTPMSHQDTILADCNFMMSQLRERYGRAPVCVSMNNDYLVGISDDLQTKWADIQITVDPVDDRSFTYNGSALNNILAGIRVGKGLTKAQFGQLSQLGTDLYCNKQEPETRHKLKDSGQFTDQQLMAEYDDMDKNRAVQHCVAVRGVRP